MDGSIFGSHAEELRELGCQGAARTNVPLSMADAWASVNVQDCMARAAVSIQDNVSRAVCRWET